MCVCSPESQTCPGLHKKKFSQQGKGGDYPHLVEPTYVQLQFSDQKIHGPVGAGKEESNEYDSWNTSSMKTE